MLLLLSAGHAGYLPGCKVSLPFGRYQTILLGDRGTAYVCEQLKCGGTDYNLTYKLDRS